MDVKAGVDLEAMSKYIGLYLLKHYYCADFIVLLSYCCLQLQNTYDTPIVFGKDTFVVLPTDQGK